MIGNLFVVLYLCCFKYKFKKAYKHKFLDLK